jgi:ABC-type antimicrobial peptide transport system permease subunit
MPQDLKDNTLFVRFLKQRKIRLEDYADYLVMTLPNSRSKWYTKRTFDETQYGVTHYLNKFIERVGFYSVSVDPKLLQEISKIARNNVLLTLLFDFVLVMFMVISVLLIHSLIMIRIETRSLETAVARMTGLNKNDLIKMMIISCSFFVVPAVILAFITCFPCLGLIYSFVLKEKLQDDFLPVPTRQSVFMALFVSIVVPFLSAIMPIKS